ncbi:MAG TPA: pantetheine-phosphate adenylyltransferase [Bacteroidetes bacterium]|nr:pantetheine-phosphate adenylyltransferase [Bacteroidota bacterium]HRK03994.1 pantetheine-phosphate adenylyltransferase [Chlorobiota bacterium]
MSRHAMYPGSFDPITNGHVDVIERAAQLFDRVTVVIARNSKKTPLFAEAERLEMASIALRHLDNVAVEVVDGLVVDFARQHNVDVIVRGIRAVTDFEYEFQIALMNRKLEPNVSTIFLMPHEKYTYLNSSIIRELGRYGQNIEDFVPDIVAERMKLRFPPTP